MKNFKLIHAFALLICGGLFLSSCGSLKDQFSHQRYTNFKVKHSSGYVTPETSASKTNDVKNLTELKPELTKQEVATASVETKNNLSTVDKKNVHVNNLTAANKQQDHFGNNENKIQKIQHLLSPVKEKKKGDPSGNTILYILLCIFLPPLACYLKDSDVSTAFWITLILCIFSFSYFFFTSGGFAWFIAMIIAFVHCFKK